MMGSKSTWWQIISAAIILVLAWWAMTNNSAELSGKSLSMSVESIRQSDGFFAISAEYPQFKTADKSFNEKISNFVIGQISDFKKSSLETWEAMKATAGPGQAVLDKPVQPFYFSASWLPSQTNEKYISFALQIYYFSGGAHGNEAIYGFNYDAANKKEISMTDFLAGSQNSLQSLSKMAKQDLIFQLSQAGWQAQEGMQEMLDLGTAPTVENFGQFTFNNEVLTVYFQRYQIAPGAFGSFASKIHKNQLSSESVSAPYFK